MKLNFLQSSLCVLALAGIGLAMPAQTLSTPSTKGEGDHIWGCKEKREWDPECWCEYGTIGLAPCFGLPTCPECGIPCDWCD